MTISTMVMIMVITVIIGVAKPKTNRFPWNFVSIVDRKRREVYSGRNIGSLRRTPGTAPSERRFLSAAVAPHGEPELLRHLRAEALPVVHGILATVPAELQYGHHDGEGEAAQQHHEHSANVLHTERVGLRVLALVLSCADITSIFPPFIVQHLNGAFLLQLQDCQRQRVSPLGSLGGGDAVPFTIQ